MENPRGMQISGIVLEEKTQFYSRVLQDWSKVIKKFSCSTNSAEHEILNARKYKKYQEIQHFSGSEKRRMLFFLLINVQMPTTVGILTFISRKNFS